MYSTGNVGDIVFTLERQKEFFLVEWFTNFILCMHSAYVLLYFISHTYIIFVNAKKLQL